MEYYAEVKVMGDAYGGGFSNGLTMCGSQSAAAFHKVEDRGEDAVYDDDRQHRIVLHKKTVGQAVEISTEFMNDSPEAVTLEMLLSFAVRGIAADRIHRLQSFWSAEGKLRTETIEELHLEPSWNRCGMRVEKFGNVGSMPVRKYFPFLAAEDSKRQEFLGIQLYCPSSWQIELLCKEDDTLTIAGGIADRDFGHWTKKVGPGERFETPKAVIARGKTLYEVCDKLCEAIRSGKYDVVIINFANPDMVGHTGVENAAIKAIEAVDECVGKAVDAVKEVDGQMFICADHGNAEQLIDEETGEPFTAHTPNQVPFILVNADPSYKLREGGCLADISPTLIEMMGMEQPKEMTGKSLLIK